MSQPDADSSASPLPRRWSKRRSILLGAMLLATAGLAVFGQGCLAWQTRQMAARRLDAGALNAAEWWLAWSAWLDPSDGRIDLMRASCLRQQYEKKLWNEAVLSAERHGAPADWIQQERQLGRIQAGTLDETKDELSALVEAGVSPDSVCTAFVHGYLARKDAQRAGMVLAAWSKERPDSAQLAFMQGVYWQWLADAAGDLPRQVECFGRAEEYFKAAVALEPRHEPARKALADLLEDQDRLEEARAAYAALLAQAPARESARLGLARVLRGLGGLEKARAVLEPLGPRLESSPAAAAEMGQIELESGNYEAAQKWLGLADPETTADADTLRAAATTFAVGDNTIGADRLLGRLDRENALWARTSELLTRLSTGPQDPKAEEELRRLTSGNPAPAAAEPAGGNGSATAPSTLYLEKCSGCHGVVGDGNGRGARHLSPPTRSFRTERFRLASTVNAIPTPEDIASAIRRGMPGTSMRAYDELSDDQRLQLAREVLGRRREGIRDQVIRMLREQDDQIDEAEIGQIVDSCTTAGQAVPLPRFGTADSATIARGKETYLALGCDKCHANDGTGVWDMPLFDEQGRPTTPRDLARDPLKGGDDPESIYLRVVVGMPGTPHPAATNVTEEQLIGLVHFCRSLFREPKRVLTNRERAIEARRHASWALDRLSQFDSSKSRQGLPDR